MCVFSPLYRGFPPAWEGGRKISAMDAGVRIQGRAEKTGFESECPPPETVVVVDKRRAESRHATPCPQLHRGRTGSSRLRLLFFLPPSTNQICYSY